MAQPPDTLRVQVLGPIRAWNGDTEIRLGPTRQRALFAVLALHPDRVVARDELINAVWGLDAPATAEGSIYTYVSGLRRALEPDRSQRAAATPLASEGTGYRLRLAPDALDAARFDALCAAAAEALARDAADDAIRLADRAVALWHGEPLAGLPGPFAAASRDRLAASRVSVLETRAAAGLRRGRHIELVPELATLVAQDPLNEGVRGLLMIALFRCGRQADALDQFRQARQTLAAELGTQPGPRLTEIHQQILAGDLALAAPERQPAGAPSPVRSTGRPRTRANGLVNRHAELTRLRDAMSSLVDGHGLAVWIEGEPGIGKSELLATALAGLDNGHVQVCWGSGDELAQRFPLRVMLECLDVDPESPDPRRARAADLARRGSMRPDLLGSGGTDTLAAVDGLVALVRELCADGALVLVVDDLQWADEASLLVWNRLARATSRLPLLLVGTCRPVPRTAALDRLRDTVVQQGGATLHLDGLAEPEVDELVRRIVGATPGPGLRRLAGRAAGNPLYVQELTDALVRDRAVRIASGTADTPVSTGVAAPASLVSAVTHRLGFLSTSTVDVLRRATLLGADFRIDALSVILARRPSELLPALDEATTAGVLIADGDRMAFRHLLVRQALYEGMAPAVRATLHRQAAQRLDDSGAPIDTVARQLAAVPPAVDPWTIGWVLANGELVANRAPDIGLELIRQVVAGCDPADPRLEALTASLARIRYWLGELPEDEARSVMAMTTDPDLAGEMRWILGVVCYRRGREHQAVATLREAVSSPGVSLIWRARCRALLAAREGIGLGERDAAETTAWTAIQEAEQAGDVFAKAYALQNLWLMRSIDRDHAAGLRLVDEALRLLDDTWAAESRLAHVHLSLLDNRVFSLQNLDRLAEVDDTLLLADEVARRHRLPAGLPIATAVQHYWTGRWDQARTELSAVVDARGLDMAFHGLRESGPMILLLHGVAALIAALRDDEPGLTEHLAAADDLPMLTSADRENSDFLIMAEALAEERAGRPDAALNVLAPVLNESYSPMMLRHQWLPDAVRIALRTNQTDVAARAMTTCEVEARREKQPARATAAAAHCRGLLIGDPEPVLWAAARYEQAGRPLELAQALENAAVLLAGAGRGPAARETLDRAVRHYEALGAAWAVRRTTERFGRADVA